MQPASQVQQNVPRHAGAMMRGRNDLPWRTLNPDMFGPGAALASGFGGQAIATVLSKRLVVVQTVDLTQSAQGGRTSPYVSLLWQFVAAAP